MYRLQCSIASREGGGGGTGVTGKRVFHADFGKNISKSYLLTWISHGGPLFKISLKISQIES
jgi:hypothetical protein